LTPSVSIVVIFGAVILLTVSAIVWALAKKRKRAVAMAEAAVRIGFSFGGDARAFLREGITDVSLFGLTELGHFEITNLMRGVIGADSVVICDYHYWTGSSSGGGTRFDHAQTVFCFELKGTRLPDFSLAPRVRVAERRIFNLVARLAGIPATMFSPLMGGARADVFKRIVATAADPGIELAGHPDFSARFQLQVADNQTAKAVFSARVVEALERQPELSFSIQKSGTWLVVYRKNTLVKPEELGNALNESLCIRALFRSGA